MTIFAQVYSSYNNNVTIMVKEFHPNRIRVVLAEKQIKNRWLAEKLGKSEMTVSRWINNKTQPSLEQLIEISKLLDVNIDDLLEPYREQITQ
jgi:transcriptional regulator with XRE-family HTH domain